MKSVTRPVLVTVALLLLLSNAAAQQVTSLILGTPVIDNVLSGDYNYYSISQLPSSPLTITVTPISLADPDLYCAFTPYPNASTPGVVSAMRFREDSIVFSTESLAGHEIVYCSVYGYIGGRYSMLAHSNEPISLLDGVPQSGALTTAPMFFRFLIEPSYYAQVNTISIVATPLAGNTLLMVGDTADPYPPPAVPVWSANNGVPVIIRTGDAHWPASGAALHVVVYPSSNPTNFTLTASTDFRNTELQNGVAVQSHTNPGETRYYVVNVTAAQCNLTVTVTPQYGDPDLYISLSIPRPGPGHSDYASVADGEDSIRFTPATQSPYYIGVVGFSSTTFSVVASLQCPQVKNFNTLVNGYPQSGSLDRSGLAYYMIYVGNTHTFITFSLSRSFGDPDLYIAKDDGVSTAHFTWASLAWGSDQITISAHDANGCINCYYYIAVFASTACGYTLTATTSDEITVLRNGVPFTDELSTSEAEYFRFDVGAVPARSAFTIVVTDLAQGDPDVYVSTLYSRPNATHSEWSGTRYRSDAITVSSSDKHFCANCTYFIAVQGYTPTNFTIVAAFDNVKRLVDGIPQYDNVIVEQFRYFEFWLAAGDNSEITFTLSVESGFAQLFVSAFAPPNHDTQYNVSTWRGSWWSSSQSVRVLSNDPYRCTAGTDPVCRYFLGVKGVTSANYTVVAFTTATNVRLQNGLPQQAQVDSGQFVYFSFDLRTPGADLAIAVTPISGDPDLWISIPGSPKYNDHPHNSSTADAYNLAYGASMVDLDNATNGLYYIGVQGYTASTFSIMVLASDPLANDTLSLVQLIDGQPQLSSVHQNHYRYFQIDVEGTGITSLDIRVVSVFGDPDVYITDDQGVFPSVTVPGSFKWSGSAFGTDRVVIFGTQLHTGVFTIGVRGYTTAGFYISATSSRNTQLLSNGVLVHSVLSQSEVDYYAFIVTNFTQVLTFSLTALTGDPDFRIGFTEYPNATTSVWNGENHFSGDYLSIPPSDPHYCRTPPQCIYYIAVRADTPTEYTFVASTSDELILSDGVPMFGNVGQGAMMIYALNVARNSHKDVTISLSVSAGLPIIYVTSGSNGLPSPTNYTWRSDTWWTGAPLVIRHTDPLAYTACQSAAYCTYHIGIFGFVDCNFTLTASSNIAVTRLVEGLPVTSAAPTDEFEYFSFYNPILGRGLDITVTAITGDPDVYVSSIYDTPGPGQSEYSSTAWGSDMVIVPNANATTYYIGVKSFINSTFTITVSSDWNANTTRVTQISDGQSLRGQVMARGYRYYRFFLSGTQNYSQVSITVNRQIGDPDIYLNAGLTLPDINHFDQRSIAAGGDTLTIAHPVPGYYTFAIYGSSLVTASLYTVTLTAAAVATRLREGVSIQSSLPAGNTAYFVFGPILDNGETLAISVTAFRGDPDLYISLTNQRPTRLNANFSSSNWGNDSVLIPPLTMTPGNDIYIAVYAFSSTAFSILARYANSSVTPLQDGVPQGGHVARAASMYFTFNTTGFGYDDIMFTLSPYTGSAFLYISRIDQPIYGQLSTYEWQSSGGASQTIVIHPTDSQFSTGPSFTQSTGWNILVYGLYDCDFTLTASTSTINIPTYLIDGWPQQDIVNQGEYAYFSFDVYDPTANISISLTPVNGNPNLYVSMNLTHPTRFFGEYTWKSENYGSDAVIIHHNDPNFRLGTYYIAVYGSLSWFSGPRNSTFFIQAASSYNNFMMTDGQPQFHYVEVERGRKAYDYFRFWVGSGHRNVTFSVSARAGQDPDLYVRNDGQFPLEGFSQWSSTHFGRDDIEITNSCSNCMYIIAVQSFLVPCSYTLVATSNVFPTELVSGVAVRDAVAWNDYSRYFVRVPPGSSSLFISVTVASGDPDLVVNGPTDDPMPTIEHHHWNAYAYGSDYVYIPNPDAGIYYIGVYGSWDSVYSISATTNILQLEDGYAQDDAVPNTSSMRYYEFVVDDTSSQNNLTISLVIHSGSVDFFMSTNDSLPSPTSYTWSSRDSSTIRGILTIPSSQVVPGAYRIVVVDNINAASTYTIGFIYGNSQLLAVGKPVTAHVGLNQWAYFRYVVDQYDQEVDISVNNLGGQTYLFAKMNERPTSSGDPNTWSSALSTPVFSITTASIPALSAGMMYIGILGMQPSIFTISVTSRTSQLSFGLASPGVSRKSGNFFYFLQAQSDVMLQIQMPNLSGQQIAALTATFFLSVNESNSEPTSANSNWQYITSASQNSFVIKSTDAHFSTCGGQCSAVFVGLFLSSNDPTVSAEGIAFTLTASTSNVLNTLSSTVDNAETNLALGSSLMYQLVVPSDGEYFVLAEPCAGQVSLFASHTYGQQPTVCPSQQCQDQSSEASSSQSPNFKLTLSNSSPFSPKYIAVQSVSADPDNPGVGASFQLHTRPIADLALSVFPVNTAVNVNPRGDGSDSTLWTVSFAPASSRVAGQKAIDYAIYWASDSQHALMYSVCSMQSHASPHYILASSATTTLTYDLPKLAPGETYHINVVAQYSNLNSHLPAVYTATSVTIPDSGGGSGLPIKLVLGIGIPVLIIVVAVMVYLILRNRKLSQELKIEMHDVPKAAVRKAVVGPSGMDHTEDLRANKQTKTYSRLLATDEDEEAAEETGYVAPDL